MRIVCWQTILMKYHTLFLLKTRKDYAKFVVCCSRDWRFKGLRLLRVSLILKVQANGAEHDQMPHSAASDQVLHFLTMSDKGR